jgi:hypothetical protein
MIPVLATVILDPTTAMIGGCAMAIFSARLIQKSPDIELGRTALLGAAWGLYYGLTVAWMYFNYTDWMLAYLIDAQKVSITGTYIVFVAILILHGGLAALGVGALMQRKKTALAWAILIGIVATNLITIGLQSDAYTHIGTFAEYWAHQAKPVDEVPRAQMGMTIAGALAAPGVLIVLALRFIQGRKATAA